MSTGAASCKEAFCPAREGRWRVKGIACEVCDACRASYGRGTARDYVSWTVGEGRLCGVVSCRNVPDDWGVSSTGEVHEDVGGSVEVEDTDEALVMLPTERLLYSDDMLESSEEERRARGAETLGTGAIMVGGG